MHIFLYEWATGGGLVGAPGTLPATLVREGATMIGALASDLMRIADCRVTALRDPRAVHLTLPGCKVIDVQSSLSHWDEFERLAEECDATILIAPEFDGILLKAARRVASCRGRLLSPSVEFVKIAGDKQRTGEVLYDAGVPVPEAVVLEPEDALPAGFRYPAVIKPVDGAGSQNTQVVASPQDTPSPYAWRRRLEQYKPGLAASVALLCGPAGRVPLVPCKQRISEDGRLRYLGGQLPLAAGLAERAIALAERAVAALPTTNGYVGVDLVLGRDPKGSEDFVIEVNPRLTTSYVGLRAATQTNLAEAMWRVARGEPVEIDFAIQPLEFDCEGNVSFLPCHV
jgi:tyramine---L-glutamate ligase